MFVLPPESVLLLFLLQMGLVLFKFGDYLLSLLQFFLKA
jgi:hypothetical protein